MSEAHRGVIRILFDRYELPTKIDEILEPIGLCVYDRDPKPFEPHRGNTNQYVDVFVEQELYGVSPLKNLLNELEDIEAVLGVMFVDTTSPYGVYLFSYGDKPKEGLALRMRDGYLDEAIQTAQNIRAERFVRLW